jgi:hypothetical protein
VAVLRAFQKLKFQTKREAETDRFRGLLLALKAKKAVAAVISISQRNCAAVLRKALHRFRPRSASSPKPALSPEPDKRFTLALAENTDLRQKVAKLKARAQPDRSLQELVEENKRLREKVQVTEQSVGLFIREMASLLDQHEPPALSEEDLVPRPPSKVKKNLRPKPRPRLPTYSPERGEESRPAKKQLEKRRLQFD